MDTKFTITVVLLAGIVGTMVFGTFLMMHQENNEIHGVCIPMLIDRTDCESGVNPLEYVRIHTSILSDFDIPSGVALAAFFLLALFGFGMRIAVLPTSGVLRSDRERRFSETENTTTYFQKILAWVALHEKRDPSFPLGVMNA
ncbi:MAG: hypothetical protein AAB495_02070 [Patescibacteria group bacterium]